MENDISKSKLVSRSKALHESNKDCSLKNQPSIVNFIDKYIDCEIIAFKLCDYYSIDEKNTNYTDKVMRIDILKKAFEHFKIMLSNDHLDNLFLSSKNTLKEMSLRVLRNNYIHNKSVSSAKLIISGIEKYLTDIDNFIDTVKLSFTTKDSSKY
jgi:hypothetical protein